MVLYNQYNTETYTIQGSKGTFEIEKNFINEMALKYPEGKFYLCNIPNKECVMINISGK